MKTEKTKNRYMYKIVYNHNEQNIKRVLKELGDGVIIAGSFCLHHAQATDTQRTQYIDDTAQAIDTQRTQYIGGGGYGDIDIFCLDEFNFQKASNILWANASRQISDTDRAVTFEVLSSKDSRVFKQYKRVQLIKPRGYQSFGELVDDFDLNNSKYWSVYPFDTVQTFQDPKTLREISINQHKMNYAYISRIRKYLGKNLELPESKEFNDAIIGLLKNKDESVYDPCGSDYNIHDAGWRGHLDSELVMFLRHLYKIKHPILIEINTQINNGSRDFLHLRKNRGFSHFPAGVNFLFDFWRMSSPDPVLEPYAACDKDHEVRDKIKEFYPELLL